LINLEESEDEAGGVFCLGCSICVGWSTVSTFEFRQFPIKKQIIPNNKAPTKNPTKLQTNENFSSQFGHEFSPFVEQFPLKGINYFFENFLNFWSKRFWSIIWISVSEKFNIDKKNNFCQKFKFGQKIQFLPKNSIFAKKFNFCQKIQFLPKNSIFAKKLNFCQKIKFLPKNSIFAKKFNFL